MHSPHNFFVLIHNFSSSCNPPSPRHTNLVLRCLSLEDEHALFTHFLWFSLNTPLMEAQPRLLILAYLSPFCRLCKTIIRCWYCSGNKSLGLQSDVWSPPSQDSLWLSLPLTQVVRQTWVQTEHGVVSASYFLSPTSTLFLLYQVKAHNMVSISYHLISHFGTWFISFNDSFNY